MIRFYTYKGCDTCRRARKWLQAHQIEFQEIPIREHPPTIKELQKALDSIILAKKQIKALFNTSGIDYRQMAMKDTLPTLSNKDALALLSKNGNLVKRPLLISKDISLIGFKNAEWQNAFNKP